MKNINTKTGRTIGLATVVLTTSGLAGMAGAASVELNGQPLATSARPITMNGRTLVPMRDIFEALGAQVNYNAVTRGISATRATTRIDLQIGNREAAVNSQPQMLDQAPMVRDGVTFVPLRFVSTALGARVAYNPSTALVSVSTGTNTGSVAYNGTDSVAYNGTGSAAYNGTGGSQVAGVRTISIPAGVVVPVTLDQELSSATSRVGETFTATVKSQQSGDSEFPVGSRIEGVITEVQAKNGDQPGVLDLEFRAVTLPDGSRYPLRAELIPLDSKTVDSTRAGRITARTQSSSGKDRAKIIGIGAAGGFILGKVLKKDGLLPAILGAVGGLIYSQKQAKDSSDANLAAGTELGVRLNSAVAYNDTMGYSTERTRYVTQ